MALETPQDGLECAETSTSLLHVLLLLGGSKYGSRVSLLQDEGALNLNSEWNGDGPLLGCLYVINLFLGRK